MDNLRVKEYRLVIKIIKLIEKSNFEENTKLKMTELLREMANNVGMMV